MRTTGTALSVGVPLLLMVACGTVERDMDAESGSGDAPIVEVVPNPLLGPTLRFTAAGASVDDGGYTTLSWQSQNVDQCTASGDWSGSMLLNGTLSVGPIDADATYTLTCDGADGAALGSVSVIVRAAALSWTSPVENVDGTAIEALSGFKVHFGTRSTDYDSVSDILDSASTGFKIALDPGTYFFSVTALDINGLESDYSNEVSKTIP